MRPLIQETYDVLKQDEDGFIIKGVKCLVVDHNALNYLTLTVTKEQLSRDQLSTVVMIDKFSNLEFAPNISCIVMIQPLDENITQVAKNIARGERSFRDMHIIFTNEPTDEQIKLLAKADRRGVIQSVRVFYGEYTPLTNNFAITTNGSVDQLGDFIKKLDVEPSGILFKGDQAKEMAEKLHENLAQRKFTFDKAGAKKNTNDKRPPVQIVIIQREQNMADLLTASLSYQSIINEFFRPGISGKLQLQDKEVPFAYFTTDRRISKFYCLDLFNVLPKVTAMRNTYISMSSAQLDTSDTKAMAKMLQEQVEKQALGNEIANMLSLCSGLRHSPLFNIYQDYVLACQMMVDPISDKTTPSARLDAIVDEIQGQRMTRSPEELTQMFELACGCALGIYVLDNLLPREYSKGKKKLQRPIFDLCQYMGRLLILFSIDDEPKKLYCQNTLKAGQKLIENNAQNVWDQVHSGVKQLFAREDLQGLFVDLPRPDFIQEIEQADLQGGIQNRYRIRPNLVALAETIIAGETPAGFTYIEQTEQSKTIPRDTKQLPTVIIYQIGGASIGEATALQNFEFYNPKTTETLDKIEMANALNNRAILISDTLLTFTEWVRTAIAAE